MASELEALIERRSKLADGAEAGEKATGMLPNESIKAFQFRIETEIEEFSRLLSILDNIISIHVGLLDSLETSWNTDAGAYIIGPSISAFADVVNRPYSTFAVIAMGGSKSIQSILSVGGDDFEEFLGRVMDAHIPLDDSTPPQDDTIWSYYLTRPLARLQSYDEKLGSLAGPLRSRLKLAIDMDNKKLRITSIKLDCIAGAIASHIGGI